MISVLGIAGGPSPPPGWARYSALPRQYVDLLEPGGGWDAQSLAYGQSPAFVSGDAMTSATSTVEAAYTATLDAGGVLAIDVLGDQSRQSLAWDAYLYLLKAWQGGSVAYINNQLPEFVGNNTVLVLPKNAAITPAPLSIYWSDPEGDSLTIDNVDALFGTLDVVANELTGSTPNTNRIDTITFRATDVADSTDGDLVLITGQVDIPDVTGVDQSTAAATLLAAYLSYDVTTAYSDTVAVGEVISQTPTSPGTADPYSTVTLTVSLGEVQGGGGLSLINNFGFAF